MKYINERLILQTNINFRNAFVFQNKKMILDLFHIKVVGSSMTFCLYLNNFPDISLVTITQFSDNIFVFLELILNALFGLSFHILALR